MLSRFYVFRICQYTTNLDTQLGMGRMNDFDVIVVGGGLAGLGTGALLAHSGARVLLLERRPILGGRALVVKQQGFTLNYGLHYVVGGKSSPHYRILERIGKLGAAPLAPVIANKLHRMRAGKLHITPTTPLDMLTTGLLTPAGKIGLAKAALAIMTANISSLWDVPTGRWLESVTHERSLRNFFLDLVGPLTFEPIPGDVSAAHFILAVRPFLMPKAPIAYYPVGGWAGIFEAFKAKIEEAGGEVRLKAQAERLATEDGRAAGVWAGGEVLRSRTVVAAVPPNELAEFLKDTLVPEINEERLKKIRPTMGVAVDLGVMGLQNEKVATIELPELNGTLGIHNLFEPSLAPEGGHLIQFLRFMTPEQMQDSVDVERSEPMIIELLETIWPGFREKIVLRRTLIRPMLTAASHRYDQSKPTLLPLKISSLPGLFLAGDATASPGELSNSAGESAILCAALVETHLREQ
jgi:phytoene dehydrogenase-like protein